MTSSAGGVPLEIVNTRTFPVSRETLFEAFADPEQLAHWWGPEGFTNTFHEFDFRPGGSWRFAMHAPNGADYENESTFVEILRPEKIAFEHHLPVHWFLMTMTFEEEAPGTRLTWRMTFDRDDKGSRKIKDFITAANEQNFDRLAAFLAGKG